MCKEHKYNRLNESSSLTLCLGSNRLNSKRIVSIEIWLTVQIRLHLTTRGLTEVQLVRGARMKHLILGLLLTLPLCRTQTPESSNQYVDAPPNQSWGSFEGW